MGATGYDPNDPVHVYLREFEKIPPLSRDEEIELLQHVRTKDLQAESASRRLIEANLRLVASIAQQQSSAGIDVLDLIQKGNDGLLVAVETFATSSSANFSAHVAACVGEAISKAIAESRNDT